MNYSYVEKLIITWVVISLWSTHAYASKHIMLYTIEIPPISFNTPNGPKGPLVDFTKLVFEEAGVEYQLKHLPIPRMLRLLNADDTKACTPAFGRIQSRERAYNWISYMVDIVAAAYKTAPDNIIAEDINALRKYKIGIQRGTTTGLFAQRQKLNLHEVPDIQMLLQLLTNGRVDLVISDHATLLAYAEKEKTPVEPVIELFRVPAYMMCSKLIRKDTLERLMKAADHLIKNKNQLRILYEKYGLEEVYKSTFKADRLRPALNQ